jgi:hypothetical protein
VREGRRPDPKAWTVGPGRTTPAPLTRQPTAQGLKLGVVQPFESGRAEDRQGSLPVPGADLGGNYSLGLARPQGANNSPGLDTAYRVVSDLADPRRSWPGLVRVARDLVCHGSVQGGQTVVPATSPCGRAEPHRPGRSGR